MGFLDELKKLTRPYDDEDDEFIDEAEQETLPAEDTKRPNPFAGFGTESAKPAPSAAPRPAVKREGRVVSLNGSNAGGQMQVVLIKPERFETAAEIADHLLAKHAVVMNLETTAKDVSRRLIDFLSGVAYAQDGKIKKVAVNTYILTPFNVDLTGDQMDELENGSAYL